MEAVKCAKPLEINRKENLKNHKWYWIGRRTQDVILSLIALVVLSPVMLITAIAIMIDDPLGRTNLQPNPYRPQRQAL